MMLPPRAPVLWPMCPCVSMKGASCILGRESMETSDTPLVRSRSSPLFAFTYTATAPGPKPQTPNHAP
jgi:hypothetical protein